MRLRPLCYVPIQTRLCPLLLRPAMLLLRLLLPMGPLAVARLLLSAIDGQIPDRLRSRRRTHRGLTWGWTRTLEQKRGVSLSYVRIERREARCRSWQGHRPLRHLLLSKLPTRISRFDQPSGTGRRLLNEWRNGILSAYLLFSLSFLDVTAHTHTQLIPHSIPI